MLSVNGPMLSENGPMLPVNGPHNFYSPFFSLKKKTYSTQPYKTPTPSQPVESMLNFITVLKPNRIESNRPQTSNMTKSAIQSYYRMISISIQINPPVFHNPLVGLEPRRKCHCTSVRFFSWLLWTHLQPPPSTIPQNFAAATLVGLSTSFPMQEPTVVEAVYMYSGRNHLGSLI